MTNPNCGDFFDEHEDLKRQIQELGDTQEQLERKAGRAADPIPTLAGDKTVTLKDADGRQVAVSTSEARRFYQEFVASLSSRELDDLVARGFGTRARPVGAEGRFNNYDAFLKQIGPLTPENQAKLGEVFDAALKDSAPGEHSMLTEKYGREKLSSMMAEFYRKEGLSQPQVMARAAAAAQGANEWVSDLNMLRFQADRTKSYYLDALGDIQDFMQAMPGAEVPDQLKQAAYGWYTSARFLHAKRNLVVRRHAQALRTMQENIWDSGHFKLDRADREASQVLDILDADPADLKPSEHFTRVVEAIDEARPDQIKDLIESAKIDDFDPDAELDEGWFNTHMRMGTALIKDSMLMSLNTQVKMNLGSNAMMYLAGPTQTTLENGFRLTKVGSYSTKDAFLESMKIHAEAHNFAQTAISATWKRDMREAFWEGIGYYNGNIDFHGSSDRMTRIAEVREMQAIIDMPYLNSADQITIDPATGKPRNLHWLGAATTVSNLALLTNKLQAATRLLFYTAPGGANSQGMNRAQAAWAALNPPAKGDPSKLTVASIDNYVPWKPMLRGMAAVDEVFGKYQFLYKLKSELEVKARMRAADLGLDTPEKRAQWVEEQIGAAVYQATPTEANIKAFRQAHGIKGELSDADVAAAIAERDLAGSPTGATEEGNIAMERSLFLRQQVAPPEGEGLRGLPRAGYDAVERLRQHWIGDRFIMPFWRSPIGALYQNAGLAISPATDIVGLTRAALGVTNPGESEIARMKASLVLSGALLAGFGALESAGAIYGQSEKDPAKRNTIFGMKVGGLPLVETLFIWKDIKDRWLDAEENRYDAVDAFSAMTKVVAATILRSSGLQQYALLMDALQDGTKTSMDRLRRYAGFMGSSQIPFIGAYRMVERSLGLDPNTFYRDGAQGGDEAFYLGQDDPIEKMRTSLKELAYDTLPAIAAVTGGVRKGTDHLGNEVGHMFGIDFSKVIPFFPAAWPKGKVNDLVYSELDMLKRLDPPPALMRRELDGIGMSDDLQQEYNDLMGKNSAAPKDGMTPSAVLGLAGRVPKLSFKIPFSVPTPSGIRVEEKENVDLPISQLLDQVAPGKTRLNALYDMFNSPWYKAYQADPRFSTHPEGGVPAARMREKPAILLVDALNEYYHRLALQELERRAMTGQSAAAKEWADKKTAVADEMRKRALEQIQPAAEILRQAQ